MQLKTEPFYDQNPGDWKQLKFCELRKWPHSSVKLLLKYEVAESLIQMFTPL